MEPQASGMRPVSKSLPNAPYRATPGARRGAGTAVEAAVELEKRAAATIKSLKSESALRQIAWANLASPLVGQHSKRLPNRLLPVPLAPLACR